MSSLEEDTELRDLVANTLQTCGVLGKIKVGYYIQVQQLLAANTNSNNYMLQTNYFEGPASLQCLSCS